MFWSNYRNYPLLSNNVGIDFCELGPPNGSKPSQAGPKGQGPEKQDDQITLGFRVKPKEKAIIQDYMNGMYNQFVVEPRSKQQKRMLENPSTIRILCYLLGSYEQELFRNYHLM